MATDTVEPDEFVNRTQGWVGFVRVNRKGDEIADTVEPGGRVFLTEEEQKLTARAHRRREDSPFVTREIVHFDPRTQEITDRFVAPLLEKVEPEPKPEREPEPDPEETAVAPAKPARRRKAATAAAA